VEEQFYIFWPWIIEKSKSIPRTLVTVIIALVLLKIGVLLLGKTYGTEKWYHSLKLAVAMCKFECMAIGGIGAYLLFTQHKYIQYFQSKLFFIASLILIVSLIYFTPDRVQDGIHLVYGVLFLTVIIYCSTTIKRSFLDHKIFNFLGKISYGIYMYHLMVIPPVLYIYHKYINSKDEIIVNLFAYPMVIGLTILIAALSYLFFEKPFIKMKTNFSRIKSGDE
jgi:peptidoglycan/LPS O-acetylase OafA/YrhL